MSSHQPQLDRWNKDEEAMSWLSALLLDPRMEKLMGVLAEMGQPTGIDPGLMPGTELIEKLALQMTQLSGYHDALRNIRTLSTTSQPLVQLDHAGWRTASLRNEHGVNAEGNSITPKT